jgi:hypothetical protein
MRRSISTLLVAVAGLALVSAAGAEQRYTEATGDAGAAPELGQTTVENDAGRVVLTIGVPPRFPEPDELYLLRIDTDSNPGTGDEGDEVRVVQMGTSANVMTWNRSDWVDAPSSGIHVRVEISASAGQWLVTLPRTLLSNTSAFDFMVISAKLSGEEVVGTDVAGPWRYDLTSTQCSNGRDDDADGKLDVADLGCEDGEDDLESDDPFTLAIGRPTVTPSATRSGAQVTVKAPIRQVETNEAITAGTVRCSAKIGASTRRWAGRLASGTATCTLRAPKVSRPTSVRGSLTVSSKSKTASMRFAFRVR